MVHDTVREEMRAVLADTSPCLFIDRGTQELLDEARKIFVSLGLGERYIIESGSKCYLISWLGDHTNDALRLLLNHAGLSCDNAGLAIEIDADISRTQAALEDVGRLGAGDLDSILANVENMMREKWDWALPESLLMKSFASISLDISTAIVFAQSQTLTI